MFRNLPQRLLLLLFVFCVEKAQAQTVAINEVITSNSTVIKDEDNSYEDWVELYNYGSSAVSLSGYGLTDDRKTPFKWIFPNVSLLPGQYMLVWASDKNKRTPGSPLHTNFKISSGGETIVLTRADSVVVDSVGAVSILANTTYGRKPDGTGAWEVFPVPTPGNPNTGLTGTVAAPTFSHASGLYQSAFNLTINHSNGNATIVYTLDGSDPDINNLSGTSYQYKNVYALEPTDPVGPFLTASYTSNTYSSPINIRDRSADADKYTKMNTRQHVAYVPPQPVRKGMIVKARAYLGGVASPVITRTFFVWPQGNPYNIPVISLQVQEDDFFDYTKGIYTAGKDYDTWRAANPSNNQWYRPEWGNYWRSGKEWEYPVHVEIFAPGSFSSITSKNGGVRIHGNNSRALAIKSLRLYARDEGNFEFNLFKEKLFEANKNTEFKRIMLRGEGTGGSVSYDVAFNRLMQPVFAGISRIKPAIHFVNGEYWGITAVRDRLDEDHFALNYNLNADNIVSVDCRAEKCEIEAGTSADYAQYIAMRDHIISKDMGNPVHFAKADSMLDMRSFIDHMVFQIYVADDSYERSYWKVRTKEAGTYGDGKWRMTTQDFEAAMKSQIYWLARWSDLTNHPNQALFANLLANDGFKTNFLNRFADLINTVYSTQRFKGIIDTTFSEVAPYLTEDKNRFPRDPFYRDIEKTNLTNWANNQPAIQRDTLVSFFKLAGKFDLNLNVSDAEAGFIKVNTVDIAPQTPGVPQNPYPWTGVYFKQIPITLKAMAWPGYVFSHWSGDASGTIDSIVLNANGNISVVANYILDSINKGAVYFWLMDNKIPNDSPLQHIAATYASNSLGAKLEFTSCLTGYPFDNQHANWRKASMERRNAPTAINYRSLANNGTAFENANIRAIQIKQPMHKGGLENMITVNMPTTNLENVKLSFAAETDGAADSLLVEYWNGTQWDKTNLAQSTFALDSTYKLFEIDFTNVTIAKNNADFKARIRFVGHNMEEDSGLRVHFNNIAMDAKKVIIDGVKNNITDKHVLRAYPNPAQNTFTVESDEDMQTASIMNLYGQTIKTFSLSGKSNALSLEGLAPSIYLVRVQWKNGEQVIRVVKE